MPYLCLLLLLCGQIPALAGELTANQLTRDGQGRIVAEGDVFLDTQELEVSADKILLDMDSQSSELFAGQVYFKSDGSTLTGDYLQRIDLQQFYAEGITYSSCPEDDKAWVISAKSAQINQEEGVFTAEQAWFELAGVPLLYTPYWQHAIKRRSGVLMPSFAQDTRRGLEITLPLYWAYSPSTDMTLSPRVMQNLGTLWDVEWRHRAVEHAETLHVQRYFDAGKQLNRHRIRSEMAWQLAPAWSTSLDVDTVSDGLFIADFALPDELLSTAYVRSKAELAWRQGSDSAVLSGVYQQRLGSVDNASTLQILPRLETRHVWNFAQQQSLVVQQQSTWFRRDEGVSGQRFAVRPTWSKPYTMLGGAVSSHWRVLGQYVAYAPEDVITTQTDYAALASSLLLQANFERISSNHQWRHAITPILQWDVSDTVQQSDLPYFDSNLAPLSMANILQGSRYSSWDRFERMQKVSLLLQSSLQHKQEQQTSRTVVEGKLGLVWDGLRSSVDTNIQAHPQRETSNLLAELAWLPTAAWRLSTGGQHNPDLDQWVEAHADIRWSGQQQQYAQLTWQRTAASHSQEAESFIFSAKGNISKRWSAHVSGQYDVLRADILQSVQGLTYQHPCWNIVLESFQTAQLLTARDKDIGFRFLLEFDGLGSFGG